jgi:hypothetical protein
MIIVVLIVLCVGGLIYWAYTEDNVSLPNIEQLDLFNKDISCNTAGDCISFFIPDIPESKDTIPVNYTIEDIEESMEIQLQEEMELLPVNIINGTSTNTVDPDQSTISGIITDTSITRFGDVITDYSYLGEHMRVQIGNIATITGNIKILEPITKQIVEPQLYKYQLYIECSDIMEFCNHTILGTRGLTESDGTFLYKWTTNNQQHLAGIYDVSIVAVSETEDLFGKKLSVAHTMFLELYS